MGWAGAPVTGAPAWTDEQIALVHPFLLSAFVLKVSAIGFWSFYRSATWLLGGATGITEVGAETGVMHPSAPPDPCFPLKCREIFLLSCQCESLTCVSPSVSAQERAIQHPAAARLSQPSSGAPKGHVLVSASPEGHKTWLCVGWWGLIAHFQPAGNHKPVSWSLSALVPCFVLMCSIQAGLG